MRDGCVVWADIRLLFPMWLRAVSTWCRYGHLSACASETKSAFWREMSRMRTQKGKAAAEAWSSSARRSTMTAESQIWARATVHATRRGKDESISIVRVSPPRSDCKRR